MKNTEPFILDWSDGWNEGRQQAIRDCIAAVYNLEPETQFSGPYQMRRAAINALHVLLEGEK